MRAKATPSGRRRHTLLVVISASTRGARLSSPNTQHFPLKRDSSAVACLPDDCWRSEASLVTPGAVGSVYVFEMSIAMGRKSGRGTGRVRAAQSSSFSSLLRCRSLFLSRLPPCLGPSPRDPSGLAWSPALVTGDGVGLTCCALWLIVDRARSGGSVIGARPDAAT